jgi:hypothetical protein
MMTREELSARVTASRTSQGLPEKISDPASLAKAARVLLTMSNAGPKAGAATNTAPNRQEGDRHD